jgi:hypothetical protein
MNANSFTERPVKTGSRSSRRTTGHVDIDGKRLSLGLGSQELLTVVDRRLGVICSCKVPTALTAPAAGNPKRVPVLVHLTIQMLLV